MCNSKLRILIAAAFVVAAVPSTAWAVTLTYSGAVTTYTIPTTGLYTIAAAGAQGGPGTGVAGGLGAVVSGTVTLTAGTVVNIVVGGMGQTGSFGGLWGGGGGGGTFVYVTGAPNPLIVAGGGGGAGFASVAGGPGQITTSGAAGLGPNGGAGGTAGAGGAGGFNPSGFNGGGGGGWSGNGGNGVGTGACILNPNNGGSGNGGFGPPTFAGGTGGGTNPPCAGGGFGGGGGGGWQGGGGGGGYSGGGGGDGATDGGGGGGSYINASLSVPAATTGANVGNGTAIIAPAFASFTVKPMMVNPYAFNLNGTFTLGANDAAISPPTQVVTLQVGTYQVSIPAGSFQGAYGSTFYGIVNGVRITASIVPAGAGTYVFGFAGYGTIPLPTANPAAVVLTVGADTGTALVQWYY